jgi:hypothetical protein
VGEGSESRLVEVLQARSRQLAHDQAELLAGIVEVSHAVAVDDLPADLPGGRSGAVARAEKRFEWAAHEIAAGVTLTPTAADRELGFAAAVCERLPLVFAALQRGEIDRGKARVFVEYLGEPARVHLPHPRRADPPGPARPGPRRPPGRGDPAEVDQRLRRHEPRILQRPAKDPPRPPPPKSDPPDDEPPPF